MAEMTMKMCLLWKWNDFYHCKNAALRFTTAERRFFCFISLMIKSKRTFCKQNTVIAHLLNAHASMPRKKTLKIHPNYKISLPYMLAKTKISANIYNFRWNYDRMELVKERCFKIENKEIPIASNEIRKILFRIHVKLYIESSISCNNSVASVVSGSAIIVFVC